MPWQEDMSPKVVGFNPGLLSQNICSSEQVAVECAHTPEFYGILSGVSVADKYCFNSNFQAKRQR